MGAVEGVDGSSTTRLTSRLAHRINLFSTNKGKNQKTSNSQKYTISHFLIREGKDKARSRRGDGEETVRRR